MKENMYDNFNLLEERVLDALNKTDLEKIKKELENITSPTICTGVGGSSVVSDYTSKILNTKNKIITESYEPRDILYKDLSGYDTNTASLFLESTLTESGIAIPVVHDKYSYCHGRSSLSYHHDNSLIYFNKGTSLDNILLEELTKYYKEIFKIDGKYSDKIIDDFYLTYEAMLLSKELAKENNSDLSRIDYSPVVKKLYYFKGDM